MSAASGWYPWAVSGDAPGRRGLWCLPGSAEGLRWHTLSGIEKPGSGTEPIHQDHVMCSRFRGSCPSDVKSAGHPEPGFPIPLSVCTAALCAPRETPKTPAAGSIPGYRPRIPAGSGRHTHPRGTVPASARFRPLRSPDPKARPQAVEFSLLNALFKLRG